MATRTFLGGNMNDASSWQEGAVPVAGDDVVIPAYATNGWLSAKLPASGQLRSFIVDNSYTGTIDLNGEQLYMFNVVVDNAVAFDCGANSTWTDSIGNGGIYFYARANSIYPNANRIIMNNSTLSAINMTVSASSAYIVLASDCYCKDLILPSYSQIYLMPSTSISYRLSIYGNAYLSYNYPGNDYWGQFGGLITFQNIELNGINKKLFGSISIRNVGSSLPYLYINGEYELINQFGLYITNNIKGWVDVYINNIISNNDDYNVYIYINKTGQFLYGVDLMIDNIDNLILTNLLSGIFRIKHINVNKKLIMMSTGKYLTEQYNYYSYYSPNKANINLSDICKYNIINSTLKDLQFNKPVTAFNSLVTNCDNVKSIDYPQTIVCVK